MGVRAGFWAVVGVVPMSGADVRHLFPSSGPLGSDSGRDGTTGVALPAGDDLSQAVRGGSGSALASSTVAVTTIVDAGAHVVRDLDVRRARSLRNFFSAAAILVRNSLTLRMLAANSWNATHSERPRRGCDGAPGRRWPPWPRP